MAQQSHSEEMPRRPDRVEALIEDFSGALRDGVGALFVGAGVSRDAGLPDWSSLLRAPADELGLELLPHDDLAAVAQYYVNHYGQNRGPLIRHVLNEIGDPQRPSTMHEAISRMTVSSVWTTNYDTLLEQAFEGFTVRKRVTDAEIHKTVPSHDIEIIKLHGCVQSARPDEVVITQEDYEDYFERRPGIAMRFETALQDFMFLFIGYSYRDPNIHSIITQARRVLKGNTLKHYMMQIRETESDCVQRQELWAQNLKGYGIECILVNGSAQMCATLTAIAERCRGSTVYVTGGHDVEESSAAAQFARDLGQQFAEDDRVVLLDGQSRGVGRTALLSFMKRCIERESDLEHRLKLFANPYAADPSYADDESLLPKLKKLRAKLMQSAAIVIAIDGGMGTRAELEVARERGCRVIPVATTDGVAREILHDGSTTEWLQKLNAGFLKKACAGNATPQDVAQLVSSALNLAPRDGTGGRESA